MSPTTFLVFEILGGAVAVLVATLCTVFKQDSTPRMWLVWAGCVFGFVQAVAVLVKFTRWVSDGSGI